MNKLLVAVLFAGLLFSACTADSPVSVNEDALSIDSVVEADGDLTKRGNMVTRSFIGALDPETIVSAGPQLCMFAPEGYCAERCPNTESPTWVIEFSGTGNGTHIGTFWASGEHCSVVEFDPVTMLPVGAVYGDGIFEMVAANGDRMTGTYGSYGEGGDGTSTTVAPGVGDFHDVSVIGGGTGRFASATGWIQDDGLFLIATGAITQWTMNGEIRYAASDRSGH